MPSERSQYVQMELYVDVDDEGKGSFRRIKKDGFAWYREVCRTNGACLA